MPVSTSVAWLHHCFFVYILGFCLGFVFPPVIGVIVCFIWSVWCWCWDAKTALAPQFHAQPQPSGSGLHVHLDVTVPDYAYTNVSMSSTEQVGQSTRCILCIRALNLTRVMGMGMGMKWTGWALRKLMLCWGLGQLLLVLLPPLLLLLLDMPLLNLSIGIWPLIRRCSKDLQHDTVTSHVNGDG